MPDFEPMLGSTAQGHYSHEAQPLLGLLPTHNAPYKRMCTFSSFKVQFVDKFFTVYFQDSKCSVKIGIKSILTTESMSIL